MKMKRISVALALAVACSSARAQLVINEVCYDNSRVADETGDTGSDWIELYNKGPASINLFNFGLGDANPYSETDGVRLPNYTLPPGGFLVVFANSSIANDYTVWTNAPDIACAPANASWRFYSSSSAPAATWKTNTFNDASWAVGVSPLGYNDATLNMDCATPLSYGGNPANRYPAAYFRKTFNLINPSVVTGLVLRARFNDGAAVYLNGKEVLRQNLPAGTITHTTLAATSVPPTLWTSTLLSTNGLLPGSNLLSVEVHQASVSSQELIMDLTLTALVNEQVPIVHGKFGLSKTGENVHLFTNNLIRIQKFDPPGYEIGLNRSYGASPDGSTSAFAVYYTPSPGLPNATYVTRFAETLTAEKPRFDVAPGVYAANQTLTITTPTTGYKIYYTLDGSDPRGSSTYFYSGNHVTVSNLAPVTSGLAWLRTNPVEISNAVPTAAWQPPVGSVPKAMVVRAIGVSPDDQFCSPETCGTYFIGPAFTNRPLPVFSLIANTNALFDFASGIYVPGKAYADSTEGYGANKWGKPHANYHLDSEVQEWERPVHLELIETNRAAAALSVPLGVSMHGGGTRALPQKTLYLLAREAEYGTGRVDYALFPDEAAAAYKRFLLRNSGNDWYGPDTAGVATMMKDAVFHRIVKNFNLSVMAYRPAVAFLNGEYWGLHNLRESFDKHYLATRYGLDADNCDLLMHEEDPLNKDKVKIIRLDGNKSADEDYEALIDWVAANPLTQAANYQQLQTQIDVINYTDYIIAETFFGNTDWPINNCDFWRAHTNQTSTCGSPGDTRWRWMLYDLDVAGEKGANYNMFDYLSGGKMTGRTEPGFLINKLWENMDFRNQFVTRYANVLNTSFRPERTAAIITQAAALIAPEVETHFRRWGRTFSQTQWQQAVSNVLVQYTAERHAVSFGHLDSHFTLGGVGSLTVRNSSTNGAGGSFTVNGVAIVPATEGVATRASWTGSFFASLGVPVVALPDPGYAFDGWVGSTLTSASRTVFVGASPQTFVARFRPSAAAPYTPSGYEQWQMANYGEQAILGGVDAEPGAPSGCAGMSNFELYAFGMNRTDGLTDAQRQARASLSINNRSNALWVGYARLNSSYTDVRYTLKFAHALSAPVSWSNAVTGVDLDAVALTNALDASTWFYEVRLPAAPHTRFFKLEAAQP